MRIAEIRSVKILNSGFGWKIQLQKKQPCLPLFNFLLDIKEINSSSYLNSALSRFIFFHYRFSAITNCSYYKQHNILHYWDTRIWISTRIWSPLRHNLCQLKNIEY